MANKKILSFAPYGTWNAHHQLDAVVGTALRMRGADVRVLLCDGLFKDCLLAGKPHDPEACRNCQNWGRITFGGFPLETQLLFSVLKPSDFETAEAWAASIPAEKHAEAEFQGVPVGKYVLGSLMTYTMSSVIDYSQATNFSASRNFLRNGALLVPAVRRHLEAYRPDHVLLFNAVHHYYRIFFEICKSQGIPVLVHEAGITYNDFALLPGFHNFDHISRQERYKPWSEVPLSAAKCAQVKSYFEAREKTVLSGVIPIYGYDTDPLKVKQALRIPEGKKVVAAFTSSDWEVGIAQCHIDITFPSQLEWLRETARICKAEGWFLIIRHHPNNARRDVLCKEFLRSMVALNREFGEHVRVLMPSEKITSYGLIWNVDVAVSLITTMGAESAVRGVPTVCVANSLYRDMGMDYVSEKSAYAESLRRGIARNRTGAIEDLRKAYRYGHHMFFGSNYVFKSFRIKNSGMDVTINSPEDLMPGSDPSLDAVCDYLLDGKLLLPAPIVAADAPERSEEQAFLQKELSELDAKRREVRAGLKWDPAGEPLVTVIRLRASDEAGDHWSWEGQMQRSRHRRVEERELSLAVEAEIGTRMAALAAALEGVKGEFVYVASGNIVPDECVLSASADLLSDPRHAAVPAVTWGGWICDREGAITGEVFARAEWETWENALKEARLLADPLHLLGFAVARVSALRGWLAEWGAARMESGEAIAEAVYRTCFAKESAGHAMRVPLLWIYPENPSDEVPSADLAFLFRISGELGKAAEMYLAAARENAADPANAGEYLKVMEEMGKGDQARVKLQALAGARGSAIASGAAAATVMELDLSRMRVDTARTSAPANDWGSGSPVNGVSGVAIPPGGPKAPTNYEEIASKVESVKGWLLAGQEKFLFDKVRSLPDGAVVIEMGANKGRSTSAMAFACIGTRKCIYSIDTFSGNDGVMGRDNDFETEWYGNLKRLGLESYCVPLKGFTFDVLPHRERFPAPHFVFIDASHEYWDVLADFKGIYDYVVEGGWIAFHDVEASWPGPWRVWEDYALHLLTDHEQVATLSCGRKSVSKPFARAPGARLGFSFAEALICELEKHHSVASTLCRALRTSLEGRQGTPQEVEALTQAEVRISEAPESDFRSHMVNMMAVKDSQIDGYARLWYGLTLIAEGKATEAYEQLREATCCSYPVPERRVAPYLQLILASTKGPFPAESQAGPRAAAFREFVRPYDTVVEYRSGAGETLRGLDCARKLGVESDRENRKRAIVDFGVDGVEEIADLPDACADLLIGHDRLGEDDSPLASLRALRAKLKRGGRAVFILREGGKTGMYAWTEETLANLFRAAGFKLSLAPDRDVSGALRISAENP